MLTMLVNDVTDGRTDEKIDGGGTLDRFIDHALHTVWAMSITWNSYSECENVVRVVRADGYSAIIVLRLLSTNQQDYEY